MEKKSPIWVIAKPTEKEETPFKILNRYADQLSEDTGDMFEGEVVTNTKFEMDELLPLRIYHAFYIRVPRLSNYSYRLMEVCHLGAKNYPVEAKLKLPELEARVVQVKNAEELEKVIIEFIETEGTREILGRLKQHVEEQDVTD